VCVCPTQQLSNKNKQFW